MNELLKKYFEGDLNAKEKKKFFSSIKDDDALKSEFIELKNTWALFSLSDYPEDDAQNHQALGRFKKRLKQYSRRSFFINTMRYAAAIVVLILSTFFLTKQYFRDSYAGGLYTTLFVPEGQRMQVTLEDGTNVWLNANSKITYPSRFAVKERHVSIEGEAFFEVAKDKKRPFIVKARNIEMEVLGTTFNVYNYKKEKEVRTSLLTGSLRVSIPSKSKKFIILKPNEQVHVIGNQMNVSTIHDFSHFLWTKGIYSFDKMSLGYILDKLALYYDVRIVVKNPSIKSCIYTGKFRQSDGIYEILRIIQKMHQFKIKEDRENNTIILS